MQVIESLLYFLRNFPVFCELFAFKVDALYMKLYYNYYYNTRYYY